jgi:hypothetical protein
MTKRLSFEEVQAKFEERGYRLLETEYKNAATKMRYICPNHPNDPQAIRFKSLKRGSGCLLCGKEKTKCSREINGLIGVAKREYPKEEVKEARYKAEDLLNEYCMTCPFNSLTSVEDVQKHCYKECPHGIGLELRKCGAIMAGKDADAVIEHYKVKFEKERIDSNSHKEATTL